jgi:hypothetical protein
VHLTLGILRQSQAVFYALSFFWLDGFAVPTPAQVTPAVGRLAQHKSIKIRRRIVFRNQIPENMKKNYSLFYLWFFVNTILFITCNILAGFTLLAQEAENSINILGAISGGFIGLFIGLIQWVILWKNFSISPLWIFSCIIGFSLYYAVNWYSGAIAMGIFQQLLLRSKVKDNYLWAIVSVISIGISGLLLLRSETLCLYGTAYGFATGALLIIYKDKLTNSQKEEVINYEISEA